MSNAESGRENPFPVNAVTTFGLRAPVVAHFAYMSQAREYLVNYLRGFPTAGAAITLSGGHGSGKTFLLNWLSNEAAGFTTRRATTLYAKADSESVPDAYLQFMRSITRSALIEVTGAAVRNIGKGIAGAAQATKQASLDIESAGTLKPAFDEKLFDSDELYFLLKTELEKIGVSPGISRQVAYAVGLLEHPQFGETAFAWLNGGEAELPKEMPLRGRLWIKESDDSGDIAVSALECIAGLYRLADIPLILILDQVENFIPRGERAAVGASLLKKLVEQISGQGAMLLLAGTPPAWERLPRDVTPRLLNRTPLIVGGLNNDECALLLKSCLRREPGFTSEAAAVIRDLSGGGNAREILQIAHRVFEKAAGAVAQVSRDDLVQAAKDSGSLADRASLALQMIDAAAERQKFTSAAAATKQGQKIDRWITGTQGATLAVVLLTSPDARYEAEDARNLTELRKELASEPSQPELLVVAVGYSSERVRALVSEISNLLVFDETKFQSEVEEACLHLSVTVPPQTKLAAQETTLLLAQLSKLDDRLARIEAKRVHAEQQTADILQEGAEELAKSDRIQAEAKTRYELRFGLDEIHKSLTEGNLGEERRILRGLLVANEANVKDPVFDYLGTIYLDALDSAQFASTSEYKNELIIKLSSLRSDIIRAMRTALSKQQSHPLSLLNPAFAASTVIGLLCALIGGAFFFSINFRYYWVDNKSDMQFWVALASLICGTLGGALTFASFELIRRPRTRYSSFANQLDRLRLERDRMMH